MIDALFGCFSGKQGKQKRSKLDLRRKLCRKKLETKQTEDEGMSWQKPSADVMENILQRVNVGDRIRFSIVSKPWNSIVTRRDIRGTPHELPWLLLPHPRKWKYLSFLSLSEGKVVKLKPPKTVRGGWVYGSTKGCLIIIKEQGLKSTMFLVNPISRALDQLPPFKTIPSFRKYIKTREWKRFGANLFCPRIAVSISDNINSNCWTMAAAVLSDFKTLGLCRPGDKTWSVFQVLDSSQADCFDDILFSCGTLYALVHSRQRSDEVAAIRTLKFGDNGLEIMLKLVYDKDENCRNPSILENHREHMIVYAPSYCSMLSESTNNEVLVIHQMKDSFWWRENHGNGGNNENDNAGGYVPNNQDFNNRDEGNNANDGGGLNIVEEYDEDIYDEYNGEDIYEDEDIYDEDIHDEHNGDEEDIHEDHDENDHVEDNQQHGREVRDEEAPPFIPLLIRTRSFKAYKIDPYNNNFIELQCLGDQLLFLGEGGSFSLPANDFEEVGKNCIYFATNYIDQFESAPKISKSREIGIFYLDRGRNRGRIERSFPSIDMSVTYQPTWFTPCF